MTVLSTLRHTYQPIYEENKCWFNSARNLAPLSKLNGVKLHQVIGCVKWRYAEGDSAYTGYYGKTVDGKKIAAPYTEDLLRKRWRDTHAWLEDDDGNVYDYLYERETNEVGNHKDHSLWKMNEGFINGLPRSYLADMGYVLTPYSTEGQQIVRGALMYWLDEEGFDDERDLIAAVC